MRKVLFLSLLLESVFAVDYMSLEVGTQFVYYKNQDESHIFTDEVLKKVENDSVSQELGDLRDGVLSYNNMHRITLDGKIDSSFAFANGFPIYTCQGCYVDPKSVTYLLKIFNLSTKRNFFFVNRDQSNEFKSYSALFALHDNILLSGASYSKVGKYNLVQTFANPNDGTPKAPYVRMIGIPSLGIIQMRYQKSSTDTSQWRNPCTDNAYRAELQAKSDVALMPCTLDTLPASAENPYHQSYYLRYIVAPNGDTTFDYKRDIIKYSPALKPNKTNTTPNVFSGRWPLPTGFEVQKVERILANGHVQNLNYKVQNRVLFLEQIKNRSAVEWVRIVAKNCSVRTLRWE